MAALALSRERIVDAALELARKQGVEQLSIRKVAQHLGVTPMALYKYVGSKDELMSLSLEAFIARSRVIPRKKLPWDKWVYTVGRRMYDALCTDYSWIRILGSVRVGAEAARVTDAFVNKLTSVGLSPEEAVRAYFAVIQAVFGAVCLRASTARGLEEKGKNGLAAATRAYLEQPDLERLLIAPALDAVAKAEQIDIALPLIIDALRHRVNERS